MKPEWRTLENRLALWLNRRGWLFLYAVFRGDDGEACPICGRYFWPCTKERRENPAPGMLKSDLYCPNINIITCATCGARLGPPLSNPYPYPVRKS